MLLLRDNPGSERGNEYLFPLEVREKREEKGGEDGLDRGKRIKASTG